MPDETTVVTPEPTPAPEAGKTLLTGGESIVPSGEPPKPGGEEQSAEPAKPAESVVPEKYDFKVPEGMTLNTDALAKFEPIAREFGLDQLKADKLVGLYAEVKQAEAQAAVEAHEVQVAEWRTACETDKELGGAKLPESVKAAQSFIARYGSGELKAILETSGLGNHPELFKLFVAAGKAMAEDTLTRSGAPPEGARDLTLLYPSMKKSN